MMSYYSTDSLQVTDFDRLLSFDISPFLVAASDNLKNQFKGSLGGALKATSTFDWKIAAISQLGMAFSKKYGSQRDSFKAVQ